MTEKERRWKRIGFSLPENLKPAPPSLVDMQRAMFRVWEPGTSDLNFERPVELTWNRILPSLREPPWDVIIEKALIEIYRRRGFFSSYLRALALRGSDLDEAAMISGGVLAGHTLIERVRDMAARVATEFYLGEPPYRADRVLGWAEATDRLQRLVDATNFAYRELDDGRVQAVKSGATQLIAEHFEPVGEETGGVPTREDAEALRHVVAHGKDAIPDFATRQTLLSYAHLMTYYFGWAMWLPFGRSAGGATPEWSDAWVRSQWRFEDPQ